jgi:4-amino-4-deoxy-L-arabinose transferase-like glycosyltransferase
MFRRLPDRAGHYLLLLAVAAVLFLPHLGTPSLWDIDEGNNAEAAREMLERGDWVVPVFNYQLRVDKPALLYWLQLFAYQLFGVGEFAARLPSALGGLATVLVTYELGRRLFGASAGLLAGLILASAGLFCASAHFANPDALLNAFTALTFLVFWQGFVRGSRGWFVPAGVSTALAVLAKGPVGLLLPATVIGLFLLWSRELRRLLDRRLVLSLVVFTLVALPWYVWVGAETKGQFLRGFLLTHNVERFRSPMEHHAGQPYYYLIALAAGFAPWSAFLGLTIWCSVRQWRQARANACNLPSPPHPLTPSPPPVLALAQVFLWCWVGVYFLFFSCSGTKLPNYILPLYPPIALLTAHFLDAWRRETVRPPAWAIHTSLVCLALIGVGTVVALLLAGGAIEASFLHGRRLPGLERWAVLGGLPLAGTIGAWWCFRRGYRTGLVASVAVASVLFVGGLLSWGGVALDTYKAPRPLVHALESAQTQPEIRVACYQYFQPSIVFYCRREVYRFTEEGQAVEFLRGPLPVYLFVPAADWERLRNRIAGPHRELARHRDLYRGCDIVLVTNR